MSSCLKKQSTFRVSSCCNSLKEPLKVILDSESEPLEILASTPLQIVGNMDAFYRFRISEPLTLFDSKQINDSQPLFWDDAEISGSGTNSLHNANQASTIMSVSSNEAGTRVRQTFRYFNYQPGKSQLVIMTGIFGNRSQGIISRMGLFTARNGLFFEQSSLGMGVVVRSFTTGSAVDTRINQADWNIDTMDGNGPSGIVLDFTKTIIYIIDYEWLGVGTIRYGVFIDGKPYYVHAIHNSNINTVVYMSTPNLPLRYEISNDGTGPSSLLTHICTTVITEGGRQQTGIERGINRGNDSLIASVANNIYPLIGLRLKSTHLGAFIQLIDYSVLCTSSSIYAYYIILNPTAVGVPLTWTPLTNSAVEYSYGESTTTLTGGTILATGVLQSTGQNPDVLKRAIRSDLTLGSSIAGVRDEIYIGIQSFSNNETFYGSAVWNESF